MPPGVVGQPGHGGRGGPWGHGDRRHHVPGIDLGVPFAWHAHVGWGALYLGFPWWWDLYWPWGWGWDWPYGYFGYGWPYRYYGNYGYPGWGGYGYPNSMVFRVPPSTETAESGGGGPAAEVALTAPEPVQGTSAVELQVSPPSAIVVLNGVVIGSVDEFGGGSEVLYLEAGEYTLEFRAPGYRSRTLQLSVDGGEGSVVSLALQAESADGSEPPAPPSPGLPHGRRFGPSFGPDAAAAPPEQPAAAPAPSGATAIVLHVSPIGAAVYLDGELAGTGEQVGQLAEGLAVSPGAHRIDVMAPGRTARTLQVDVKAGQRLELSVTLD